MSYHNAVYASSGVTSGFSFTAVIAWLAQPSNAGGLAALGSIVSAIVTFIIAKRGEIRRANEQAERDRQLAEVLNFLRIQQALINAPPAADGSQGGRKCFCGCKP